MILRIMKKFAIMSAIMAYLQEKWRMHLGLWYEEKLQG